MSFVPHAEIDDYKEFHRVVKEAYRKEKPLLRPGVIVFCAIMLAVGALIVFGAFGYLPWDGKLLRIGAVGLIAWVLALIFDGLKIHAKVQEFYLDAWCSKTGWFYSKDLPPPAGHPLENNAGSKDTGEGFEFTIDGHQGGICEYEITTGSGKHRKTTSYTISWIRMDLPFSSMEFSKRSGLDNRLFDLVDSKLTDQHVVEFESIEFNQDFKLQVHDSSDENLIMRLFTPAVIDGFLQAKDTLPEEIIYNKGALWHVETYQKIRVGENLEESLRDTLDPLENRFVILKGLID